MSFYYTESNKFLLFKTALLTYDRWKLNYFISSFPASEPWVRFYGPSLWRPGSHLLALLPPHPHIPQACFSLYTSACLQGPAQRPPTPSMTFFLLQRTVAYVICPIRFGNQWHTIFFFFWGCVIFTARGLTSWGHREQSVLLWFLLWTAAELLLLREQSLPRPQQGV